MEAPQPQTPSVGDVVAGKYELIRVLGEGGMGIVYEGRHLRLEQRVAIKMLQPHVLEFPEFVVRFEREARASARLRSRHVAKVIDVGEADGGQPYMVLEYLLGRDLDQELEARGPLPVEEALSYILQAMTGMAEAHALGIVHRDLKPANLYLAEESGADGAERVIKVLDFGISKLDDGSRESRVTSTQAVLGTPLYMSPEQLRSTRQVDRRSDIWALGVILYEILAGKPPFFGSAVSVGAAIMAEDPTPLSELRPELPPALVQAIMVALRKKADDRYQSVEEFAAALRPFLGGRASLASFSAINPYSLSAATTGATSQRDAANAVTVGATSRTLLEHTDQARGEGPHGSARRKAMLALAGGALIALGATALLWFGSPAPSAQSPTNAPTDPSEIGQAQRDIASSGARAAIVSGPAAAEAEAAKVEAVLAQQPAQASSAPQGSTAKSPQAPANRAATQGQKAAPFSPKPVAGGYKPMAGSTTPPPAAKATAPRSNTANPIRL